MIELDHFLVAAIADLNSRMRRRRLTINSKILKEKTRDAASLQSSDFEIRDGKAYLSGKMIRDFCIWKIDEEGFIDMETIIIESEQIRLPKDVLLGLKGKKVRFLKHHDGFYIKPVSDSAIDEKKFPKLSKLKPRKLIEGDPEDLIHIKTWEWNEPCNL